MVTYPGLPGPQITPYLTREASRGQYAAGTEFAIDRLSLLGNTGTYLDAPYHRYSDGADLSGIALARTADLPAVVVRVTGAQQPGIDVGTLAALDVAGAAVLLHTGDDARFGTPAYADQQHFLTRPGAAWLADHHAALVGIDALNIDAATDGERPAHTRLLAAGIPVVEHLTGLEQLPPTVAWFTAVPLRIENSAPSRCAPSPAYPGSSIRRHSPARRPGQRQKCAFPVSPPAHKHANAGRPPL
jgi:kynurenine formamidase